ncbi:unnamed protein product [Acanthosepion pharaonis]|uniref:Uncharacterized protein n=1 Tax=Acanthosepion pharaonis TaxID=158019 RepID=A0A812D248_ACAPH|nr:unnamed protein product [Sepia pharaonis]
MGFPIHSYFRYSCPFSYFWLPQTLISGHHGPLPAKSLFLLYPEHFQRETNLVFTTNGGKETLFRECTCCRQFKNEYSINHYLLHLINNQITMPTLILLDVSLSMSRPVNMQECSEEYQRRHLAIHGINTLLDYMAANCKLEFTSLIVFSYLFFLAGTIYTRS